MDEAVLTPLIEEYAQTREPALRDRIVCAFMPLAQSLARKFPEYSKLREDLVQVGYVGLIKALDCFDPGRGVRFSTYAVHSINGEIRHFLRDRVDTIRPPRWMREVSHRVNLFISDFMQKNERLPGVDEISRGLNLSPEGVEEIIRMKNPVFCQSFEDLKEAELDVEKIKSLRYESFKLPIEDRIMLNRAVEKLRYIEKKIVYLFFYLDLTETQIARKMGFSQKKVSRLLQESVSRLKTMLTRELW
jgi:RNA polymerase sigma-B factor